MTTETRRYWLARLNTCTECGLVWGVDATACVEVTLPGAVWMEPPADCPACAHRRILTDQRNAYAAARELVERLRG